MTSYICTNPKCRRKKPIVIKNPSGLKVWHSVLMEYVLSESICPSCEQIMTQTRSDD